MRRIHLLNVVVHGQVLNIVIDRFEVKIILVVFGKYLSQQSTKRQKIQDYDGIVYNKGARRISEEIWLPP